MMIQSNREPTKYNRKLIEMFFFFGSVTIIYSHVHCVMRKNLNSLIDMMVIIFFYDYYLWVVSKCRLAMIIQIQISRDKMVEINCT